MGLTQSPLHVPESASGPREDKSPPASACNQLFHSLLLLVYFSRIKLLYSFKKFNRPGGRQDLPLIFFSSP